MAITITDVDDFTTVQAPGDGDPANGATFLLAPQALANRTRNLKNRDDGQDTRLTGHDTKFTNQEHYAVYQIGGTNIANGGANLTLTENARSGTEFSLASNVVTISAAGLYLISVNLTLTCAASSNPCQVGVLLQPVGPIVTNRFSAGTLDAVSLSASSIISVSTTSQVYVSNSYSSGSVSAVAPSSNYSLLTILRLK